MPSTKPAAPAFRCWMSHKLSTGEDIPRGQRLRARVVMIEVSAADVDWTRLAGCQREAANGLYARAMAGFLRWLGPRHEQIRDALPRDIAELQAKAHSEGQHRRAVANVASLAVGIRHWLRFAQDSGPSPAQRLKTCGFGVGRRSCGCASTSSAVKIAASPPSTSYGCCRR